MSERTPISTQILAVLIVAAVVGFSVTTTRKDKAWKELVKKLGLDKAKVEQVESDKK